jgi:hypothetical protein
MTRVAVIDVATSLVINVIELVRDEDGNHPHWPCPDECLLIDAVSPAQIGATWDGATFTAPVKPAKPRIDILMAEGPATEVYNEDTETMVDRPAEDIAADKTELLGLLHTKLAETGDLTWNQMNKMLALERE